MLTIQRIGLNPIERVFGNPFGMLDAGIENAARDRDHFSPAADVRETKEGYAIDLDLPGLTEKDVEVMLEGRHLTIRGERKPVAEAQFVRRERGFGFFERIFRLPDDVDNERIEAKAKDGVLTLHLPKAEASKPRSISVVNG